MGGKAELKDAITKIEIIASLQVKRLHISQVLLCVELVKGK